ncbi:MAG: hypothetical protein M3463_01520 [Verrucomicrobiota bacterium]|nr:hypothetical protein [Verrucomicrobiota bacterium]
MSVKDPRALVPNTTVRDALIAIACGALVLGFLVYGIFSMATAGKQNALTGTVVGKQFVPAPEQQISVGNKGLKAQRIEGEYLLEVRVEADNRTYQVPVRKEIYEARKVGDSQTFLRPPDEQK